MEERADFKPSSLRPVGNLKSALSGRSTPRASSSFRRFSSTRTFRRDSRSQWIRNNSVLLWLLLITLWAYLGFYVQSKWAHGNNNKHEFADYTSKSSSNLSDGNQDQQSKTVGNEELLVSKNGSRESQTGKIKNRSTLENMNASPGKKGSRASSRRSMTEKKRKKSNAVGKQRGKTSGKANVVANDQNDSTLEEQEEDIPKRNTTYGFIVGPFASTEERILEWSPEKRSGSCDRNGDFRRLVWSRRFVLVFHDLSITGPPLAMMELATELMSCGGTVSAVILNKKGGLMQEINRRMIKVIEDSGKISFKAAMKADLVIAGSALCASWIEKYHEQFPASSSQIAWWIMENRQEYFNRSKLMLNRVKMLIFLSESQSKQWSTWCQEEGIKLYTPPAIVPLSVSDELAFAAGIPCSLNTPMYSVEKMLEKRKLLRDTVRKEMGLSENDMLLMSLSSIKPEKGQLLLLESANTVVEHTKNKTNGGHNGISIGQDDSSISDKKTSRSLLRVAKHKSGGNSNKTKRKTIVLPTKQFPSNNHTVNVTTNDDYSIMEIFSGDEATQNSTLKLFFGSVGSKSNKVSYVKGLLQYLSQHSELSKVVLWTPETTHVASLYSAADAYIVNSQGLGETFGRVTIEAMAYSLPVLGTDAGGTKEIIEQNVTGLLHPLGQQGTETLVQNLLFFLNNPAERRKMGMRGRKKVVQNYLKRHTYKKFAEVLSKCMKPK